MVGKTLGSVINDSFITRLVGPLQRTQASGRGLAGQSGRGDVAALQQGLRQGAEQFVSTVDRLNRAASFVNIAQGTLGQLSAITDRLIDITEQAASSSLGRAERGALEREYDDVANGFKEILEQSKIGDNSIISKDGLSAILSPLGLDPEKITSLEVLFEQFQVSDEGLLADEGVQGPEPSFVPQSAYGSGVQRKPQFESLFSNDTTIATRPGAYVVLNDLRALKEQLVTNIDVINDVQTVTFKNLELARAAGFGLLELSQEVSGSEDAVQIATELAAKIRARAGSSLSEVGTLDALVVSSLTS
jgi:hypothetical protein